MALKKRRLFAGFLAAAFMTAAPPAATTAFAQTTQAVSTVQATAVAAPPAADTSSLKDKVDVSSMTEWRHDIHAHPETAYGEVRTAEKIDGLLRSWGLETHTNVGKTGVVGILRGPNTGPGSPSICLRADIDALPITETTGVDYASTTAGKDHACGHDGHTAMLLGAAKYLAETKNFTGTVYFIFQPAEEGGAGAKAMIDDGLFQFVHCDGIYGMHAWPGLPAGQIGIAEGDITAASDNFSIHIIGKGGHAAYPADNIDAISMAADIVSALHHFKDDNVPANEGAVLAVTMLHGGEAINAMPEKVDLAGTVRTFSPETQDKLEKGIKETAERIAATYGAKVEVTYTRGYPSVFNSHDQVEAARKAAGDVVGASNVVPFKRTMAGEDFSYYSQIVPGAYIALGQWDGKSPKTQLHSPDFNFNDATLATGASYWIDLVQTQMPLKPAPQPPVPQPSAPKP